MFGATNNIPAITTDHATRYYLDFLAVKTLKNVISLIGNLASSVIVHILLFNDSSVVRLKEYKEIHKEARLL